MHHGADKILPVPLGFPGSPSSDDRQARKRRRREKQRQANAGRALKMRAARLAAEFLPKSSATKLSSLNVGCSGWFYWHWREAFYPADIPTQGWFSHYARNFSTVELNAPFYSWPTVNTVKGWLKQARTGQFVYTGNNRRGGLHTLPWFKKMVSA